MYMNLFVLLQRLKSPIIYHRQLESPKMLVEKFNPSPKTRPRELVQNLDKISKVQEQECPMKWGLMFCSNSQSEAGSLSSSICSKDSAMSVHTGGSMYFSEVTDSKASLIQKHSTDTPEMRITACPHGGEVGTQCSLSQQTSLLSHFVQGRHSSHAARISCGRNFHVFFVQLVGK